MTGILQPRRGALIVAAAGAASTLVLSVAPADAQWRRHHHRGIGPGAAIGLGIAGALIAGGDIAASRPRPVIVDEPYERECWYERRRVWDGYGYVRERVRVCE